MIRLNKWLGYGSLGLLCVLLLLLSLTPPVVRWQVENWLAEQEVDAEFQHLSVSLGRGRLELGGIFGRGQQGQVFALKRLVLDVALMPLLEQRLVVESFELDGLSLDVSRLPSDTLVGGLSLASLTASPEGQSVKAVSLTELDSVAEAELDWSVLVQHLRVTDLKFCLARESASRERLAKHCLGVAEVALKGHLLLPSLQRSSLQLPGELSVIGLKVDDAEHELNVLSVDALGAEGVTFVSEQLQLQRFSLQGLALLERQDGEIGRLNSHAGLGNLQLQRLTWEPEALDIGALRLSDLALLLHRDRAASPVLMSWAERLQGQLEQPSDGAKAAVAEPKQGAQVPDDQSAVRLQSFIIDGRSTINILDEAVQPLLDQSLSNLYLELRNIDSRKVQQGIDLKLTGRLGEFGDLAMDGELWPFRDTLSMNLEGRVEALDLLPFSAYLEQSIGYQVQTGQLNQQLQLTIKDDIVDARIELELDKLYLQTLSAAQVNGSIASPVNDLVAGGAGEVAEVETTLLPIGVALNLLRDSDDKIQLVLPVSGHIDDPSLSVAYVLGVVMRKAMTAAVMNYYAPFGLIDLASMLADSATTLKFEPFVFVPGEVNVSRAQSPRLDKFSQLLADKPQLSLSLCGSASGMDALHLMQLQQVPEAGLVLAPAQHQQLRDLVSARLKGVKSELINKGGSARQLVLCQPVLALDEFTDAEVDVSL